MRMTRGPNRNETPDDVPTEDEIRTAVRRLPKGKACGPTGVRAENLKDWLFCQEDLEERPRDPNSDPPEYAQWKLVTDLVKHIFTSVDTPGQFSLASLVLVPKAEQGKFRGIPLLEPLYKVIGTIIARRINTAVEYHDGVHGFRPTRGCGTAIVATKLQMQLARKRGRQYHQVFLDLSKAYDTIDQPRLLEILSGYGMGPKLRQVLESAWQDSRLAPKMGNLFGGTIFRNRGVQQGDPLSPTLFNLVIDSVIRATAAAFQDRNDDISMLFYADDGKLAGTDAEGIQLRLDHLTDLFARLGLRMNATKTVSMTARPNLRRTSLHHGAYRRIRMEGGALYQHRSREITHCPECNIEIQKRSLLQHIRNHHPDVPLPDRPDLYTPSPDRPPPRVYRVDQPNGEGIMCPHELCEDAYLPTRSALFRHWAFKHHDLELAVTQCPNHRKCPRCSRYLGAPPTQTHFESEFCKAGARRQQARRQLQFAEAPAPIFTVNDTPLDQVNRFRYLGRMISHLRMTRTWQLAFATSRGPVQSGE